VRTTGYEPIGQEESTSRPPPVPLRANVLLKYINCAEQIVLVLAILIHCGILVWAVADL
jgi:hypothetical protein